MGASQSTASSFRPPGVGVLLPGSYLGELGSEIEYERSIGSSRFLKAIKARHRQGALVVKVFVKLDPHMDLRPAQKRMTAERAALADCPNLLPYNQALATERAGYLIRQWVASSLYDRISTRPFLGLIEKKWITFQLLTALKDLHARKISHGDIKSENVLVTSSTWVYLSDFASVFKPTYLPEDDPSDFSYFFDTSGRRTCYIAPERFYVAGSEIGKRKAGLEFGKRDGRVTEQMDVFALGCVVAELFVEGSPPFTLSQMLRYRSGDYTLEAYLTQIEDEAIRGLVRSMTSLSPSDRLSCEHYLSDAYGRVFPESFYDYFHDFIAAMNEISSSWPPLSSSSLRSDAGTGTGTGTGASTPQQQQQQQQAAETPSSLPLPSNADEIIGRIWADFDQMESHFSGRPEPKVDNPASLDERTQDRLTATDALYPLHLNITTISCQEQAEERKSPSEDGPALLILSLVCANVRNCVRPTSIIRALDVLLATSRYLTDETKLDRMLPFVVALLQNDAAAVRAAALRTLTQVLASLDAITPSNATIFPEYVLPNVVAFASDQDEFVRCVYAQSLASLAESGQRYLDMTQAMKADGTFKLTRAHDFDGSPYEMSYDASLLDLQNKIQEQISVLLIDHSSSVKRALVANITPLCVFLGRSRTSDVFGLMTTHLNDRDWLLRSAFFESTVGISTCIGSGSVDEYILPLMTEALADSEETVIARELNSLSTLAELGLYQRSRLWETLAVVLPLLCHPNLWVRSSAAGFIASTVKLLPETDVWCTLYPALRKMLKADISQVDEISILGASVGPLSRPVHEAAISWAARSSKSPFWQPGRNQSGNLLAKGLSDSMKVPILSEEDKAEMKKLQSLGMTERDSFKLLAMREYLAGVAAVRKNLGSAHPQDNPSTNALASGREVALAGLGVTPQNIIFSTTDGLPRFPSRPPSTDGGRRRFSIDLSRPTSSADFNRFAGARSVSGSSTADALRRRLVQGSNSTSSLHSFTPVGSPQASGAGRSPYPASPASLASASDKVSDPSAAASAENLANSSATVRPGNGQNVAGLLTKKNSRMNMRGVEVLKATAAIGSDMTTALGLLSTDGVVESESVSGFSTPARGGRTSGKMEGRRFTSTYEGDDPSIKQLLDRVYLDNYREPMPEFGPHVQSKVPRKRGLRSSQSRERSHRRPEGTLISHLVEHTAAVTSIAVSPDHLFFASGSEDGNVKVWDTTRLEKNVTSRSRHSVHQGGKITSVVMLESSHCVASASDNGTLWVSRVDVQLAPGSMPRYGPIVTIRQHLVDSPSGDFVTCMLHFDTDSASKLVYATSQSKIVVLDIRTLRTLESYENPRHLGPISCICVDKKHSWLVVGTLAGTLSLWDLRFGLLLRTWRVGDGKQARAIYSCSIHRTKGKGKWVVVTLDGSEGFEVWDIEHGTRVEVFRSVEAPSSGLQRHRRSGSMPAVTMREPELKTMAGVELNAALAIEMLLSSSLEPDMPVKTDDQAVDSVSALHGFQHRSEEPAIYTVLLGTHYGNAQESTVLAVGGLPPLSEIAGNASLAGVAQPSPSSSAAETGWIVSGGEDRKLRFWDLGNVERSCIICGAEEGDEKPTYSSGKATAMAEESSTTVTWTTYTEARQQTKNTSSNKSQRAQLIAHNQQTLLRAHQDAIQSLALLELPFRCIVSGDRSGVIKVWE